MDSSLTAIFNAAQTALRNDARQTLLSGAQARQNAFARINNNANAKHMLYSGMPAVGQLQYDQGTFIPSMSTAVVNAVKNQAENQEAWDKFSQQIKELNDASSKLESAVPAGWGG
jgi:hypothetical protein